MIYRADNTPFSKLIELDEVTRTDEPTIRIVRPRDLTVPHVKVAEEALDYIKNVKPIPGKTIILVLAMTAGEYYGCNRNGDAWSERPLTVGKTQITADDVLPRHYKTFETNARVFRHHVNKDPEKRIGDVVRAFYNWPMHRVELLLALDNARAESIVNQIESGEFPAVSMGCFLAGTKVTLVDGSRKPIEDIRIGDAVLTHTGKSGLVTSLQKRDYSGKVYRVRAEGEDPVYCTSEHPFLSVPQDQVRIVKWGSKHGWKTATTDPQWVPAEHLDKEQNLLCSAFPTEITTPDYVTEEFARLLGYYLADGSITRNRDKEINGFEICASIDNPIHQEIDDICTALSVPNSPCRRAHAMSDKASVIGVYGHELAARIWRLCSGVAKTKTLDASVLLWDPALQRVLLGAYINGDGCCTPNGALQISTASENLAHQVVLMLQRIGVVPSLQCVTHKPGKTGFNFHETEEWITYIGKQQTAALSDVCYKVKAAEIKSTKITRKVYGAHVLTPIREFCWEEHASIPVYNFSVAGDESYQVNGLSVHNCKIKFDVCSCCGNKAPNRAAYCDHAAHELTRYLPDGRQVFVWNPSPTFFDISIVRRPADRVGFMMKKVADHVPEIRSSAEMGERIEALTHKAAMAKKLSVINKIVNGDIAAAREDNGDLNVVKDFADRVARPAASTMPAIDDTLIRELLKHRPAEVLATLSSLGIFLTTPEFIKYFVWKADPTLHIPEEVLQRAVDMQQDVFEALAKNPEIIEEIENTGILNLTPDKINPALANRLSSLCEKRSQADEFLQARLVGQILKTAAGTRGRLTPPGTFPWETTPSTPADINAAKSYGGRYLEPGQGYWDQLNVADPHTGQVHATTRGAAIRGHQLWRREKWLMPIRNLFGTGATLSAAQKFVGQPNIPMTPYQRRAWAYSRPWQTTEGEEIAPGTELKTGSHEPDLKSTIIRLAHDGMFGSPHQKVGSCSSAAAPLENATLADVVNWVGTVICP